jgi:hypothetical protein
MAAESGRLNVAKFDISLSFGGGAERAPVPSSVPPPPLPVAQKGGGPIPEPFNRMVNIDAAGDAHPFRRPMEQSAWVMSAILTVAEPISGAPLKFSMMAGDGTETLYKNPALSATPGCSTR